MREFGPADVRLMQGLAVRVAALRPDIVNNNATLGELAWVYGKDHAALGDTWRHRLWRADGEVVGWGWIHLPYRVRRSDGGFNEIRQAYLAWQVHPRHPEVFDEILDWYAAGAGGADRTLDVREADTDALARLAAHGYLPDEPMRADDGFWQQLNGRELTDLEEPVLPAGFRFRTAGEAGAAAAVRAHVDAWHPSSFTDAGYAGARQMWPYREDLHLMVEAPDGTMASTVIMWLDEHNRTAEFEPVGTHPSYRRQGIGSALLRHGMRVAAAAGAERMTVSCLAGAARPTARGLYLGVGFRPFTRDVPRIAYA